MSFDTPFRKGTILLQVHVLQGENANNYASSYRVCTCLFVERTEQEENIQIKEYQDHIQQLREAYESQGETYQQLYLQHEEALKVWFLRQRHFFYSILISENYKVFSTQPS
jgi:hypothetical protein